MNEHPGQLDKKSELELSTFSNDDGFSFRSFAILAFFVFALPIVYWQGVLFFSAKQPGLGFWTSAAAPWVAFSVATTLVTIVLTFQLGFGAVVALVKHFILRKPSEFNLDKFSKWPALLAFFGSVLFVGFCFGILLAFFSPLPYFPTTIQMGLFCVLTCTPAMFLDSW